MSEYRETIKNLDKVRSYMRDLYIYGFRTRRDFSAKSARTYDNERRRIGNWLSDYITWDYSSKGKSVCISVDSSKIESNPLFAAWKSKSFTDNDITLHFLLIDLLSEGGEYSAPELTEMLSSEYDAVFDLQTVRGKLREYEREGIFESRKEGKALLYSLSDIYFDSLPYSERLCDACSFFSEVSVGGYIGSTLTDKYASVFRFKHHFIAHTLDDGIVLELLSLIRQKKLCVIHGFSRRSGQEYSMSCVPLQIIVSVQSGRRYVTVHTNRRRRLTNLRIDSITDIKPIADCEDFERFERAAEENTPKSWGTSFDGTHRIEQLFVKLYIDEEKEGYVLQRLRREGRSGEVTRLDKNIYLYSVEVYDSHELTPWLRTFMGRILEIEGTNRLLIDNFWKDIKTMQKMYGEEN